METDITLWWLGGGVALAVLGSFGDLAGRRRPLAWHAYLPWRPAIFLGVGIALFAAVHLLTLVKAAAV